jgi:hypothetical protein
MIKLTEDSLYKLLVEKNLKPIFEEQSKSTYLNMKVKGQEVPVFFAVRAEGNLLQTIAYLPYELHEKAVGDVARLLHILNREVDIPGFGMDETQKLMFFRCVIIGVDGMLDPKLLDIYLATTRIAVETFMEAIATMAGGKTTVDAVLKGKKQI